MSRLVLASRNSHKVIELERILARAGVHGLEIVGVGAFPHVGEVAETGTTFEQNALLKARAVAAGTGLPAVADDSGLCVDVLNGCPGLFSARWSGRHGDDDANLDLLLGQLSDVPDEHRSAAFVCAAVLALPTGPEQVTAGRLAGRVIRERRGTGGFGYDPIFIPDGLSVTTAQLSDPDKDAISHRGMALRALLPALGELVAAR